MLSSGAESSGWLGQLHLDYAVGTDARTFLRSARHLGPLRVQRAFRQSDGSCHTYVLHPPGGVVGGDRLEIAAELRANARALVTTPGASKYYRSAGPFAHQDTHLRVASGAYLEWLPQEAIAFAGTQTRCTTRIELEGDAGLTYWDIVCLGRPAASESFSHGRLEQRTQLWLNHRLHWLDLARYGDPALSQDAAYGQRGFTVVGTLLHYPASAGALDELRQFETRSPDALLGSTVIGNLLVCRYLGAKNEDARRRLAEVWLALRRHGNLGEAIVPRVWST